MLTTTLSILALLSAATAQSTVNLILPNTDTQLLVGEVIGVEATATTYIIECAIKGSSGCGFNDPFTLIEGPSTLSFAISASLDGGFTASVSCALTGSPITAASCAQSLINGTDTYTASTTYASYDLTDLPTIPVTITATNLAAGGGAMGTGTGTSSGMGSVSSTTMTDSGMGMTTSTGMTSGSGMGTTMTMTSSGSAAGTTMTSTGSGTGTTMTSTGSAAGTTMTSTGSATGTGTTTAAQSSASGTKSNGAERRVGAGVVMLLAGLGVGVGML